MPGIHQSPIESNGVSLNLAPTRIATSATAAGATVDMQGFDGVAFLISVGTVGATVDMIIQESPDNSTWTSQTGYSITQYATGDAGKTACVDVYKPTQRYIRPLVTNGGTATSDASVLAFQYRATGRSPITLGIKELVKKVQN